MIPAPVKPLRLAAIKICGFRGFPEPIEIRFSSATGVGQCLLLYGENGSGKSSVGKAIRDLLDSRKIAPKFEECEYRFAERARPDRGVTLLFDNPEIPPLAWTPKGRDLAHAEFRDMARAKGWLDYRAVWRASELQLNDSADLFRPLVEEILPQCQRGSVRETFGQAWEKVLSLSEKRPMTSDRKALSDLRKELNLFNESLEAFLPELEKHANDMLVEFVPWTSMVLEWVSGARYDPREYVRKLYPGTIKLRIRYRGDVPLKDPLEILNEARLTAIGLCIYLTGLSRSIPPKRTDGSTYPHVLILDDILLSLDMAHRLPLLKVIKQYFKEWQVFLLTHDRNWYEITKQQLQGWSHTELFSVRVGNYEQPVLRDDQDHLYWAIEFLAEGHVKAAAVHVRTKFEVLLRWACHELGIRVKYNTDPRKVPVSDLWAALKSFQVQEIPPLMSVADAKKMQHTYRPEPRRVRVVSIDLERRIEHAVTWILNPLSHSQVIDSYRSEIEESVYVVDELERAIADALLERDRALARYYFVLNEIAEVLGKATSVIGDVEYVLEEVLRATPSALQATLKITPEAIQKCIKVLGS